LVWPANSWIDVRPRRSGIIRSLQKSRDRSTSIPGRAMGVIRPKGSTRRSSRYRPLAGA
jgi:hypothetical protein